jgi:hypothetical protein
VTLEVFEDVGLESKDGKRVAVQTKSATATNPIANHAVELWKAFANWVRACVDGQLDPSRTTFQIYVSKPCTGQLVTAFAKAVTDSEAAAAIEDAVELLWGEGPEYAKRTKLATTLQPHVEAVLAASSGSPTQHHSVVRIRDSRIESAG